MIGPGNVISANLRGVLISGPSATGNQVTGNLIGTDETGLSDLGNAREGIRIESASNNLVTGDANGTQVISGNNQGVVIVSGTATATGNILEGNFIGADKTGRLVLGNSQAGVSIDVGPRQHGRRNIGGGAESDLGQPLGRDHHGHHGDEQPRPWGI